MILLSWQKFLLWLTSNMFCPVARITLTRVSGLVNWLCLLCDLTLPTLWLEFVECVAWLDLASSTTCLLWKIESRSHSVSNIFDCTTPSYILIQSAKLSVIWKRKAGKLDPFYFGNCFLGIKLSWYFWISVDRCTHRNSLNNGSFDMSLIFPRKLKNTTTKQCRTSCFTLNNENK